MQFHVSCKKKQLKLKIIMNDPLTETYTPCISCDCVTLHHTVMLTNAYCKLFHPKYKDISTFSSFL